MKWRNRSCTRAHFISYKLDIAVISTAKRSLWMNPCWLYWVASIRKPIFSNKRCEINAHLTCACLHKLENVIKHWILNLKSYKSFQSASMTDLKQNQLQLVDKYDVFHHKKTLPYSFGYLLESIYATKNTKWTKYIPKFYISVDWNNLLVYSILFSIFTLFCSNKK